MGGAAGNAGGHGAGGSGGTSGTGGTGASAEGRPAARDRAVWALHTTRRARPSCRRAAWGCSAARTRRAVSAWEALGLHRQLDVGGLRGGDRVRGVQQPELLGGGHAVRARWVVRRLCRAARLHLDPAHLIGLHRDAHTVQPQHRRSGVWARGGLHVEQRHSCLRGHPPGLRHRHGPHRVPLRGMHLADQRRLLGHAHAVLGEHDEHHMRRVRLLVVFMHGSTVRVQQQPHQLRVPRLGHGCSWSTLDSPCSGTPTPCSQLSDSDCTRQGGCTLGAP